jgi:hypothetical protein
LTIAASCADPSGVEGDAGEPGELAAGGGPVAGDAHHHRLVVDQAADEAAGVAATGEAGHRVGRGRANEAVQAGNVANGSSIWLCMFFLKNAGKTLRRFEMPRNNFGT